jgi:monoamine oxidase
MQRANYKEYFCPRLRGRIGKIAELSAMEPEGRSMPTLYTTLRAQHHHSMAREPLPEPHLPTAKGKPLLAASETEKNLPPEGKRRIAIIGAGFAGLCAAYELRGLHYDVTVFEARDRVGGRVHSLRDENLGAGRIEGGGELIGSNHPLWISYARHFGLKFSDAKDYGNSPVRVGRRTLSFDETQKLSDEMDVIIKKLTDEAETIEDPFEPWVNLNARRLDKKSLAGWINRAKKCSGKAKQALKEMLEADNGVRAGRQSLLGVLAMVKGGGLDRYWSDTEVFRCEGGNDQLAKKFCEHLRSKGAMVQLNRRVTAVNRKQGKIELTLAEKDGRKWKRVEAECPQPQYDRLIVAVPPSVWRYIDFKCAVPMELRKPPKMGANIKFLLGLRKRFWEDFSSSPNLSTNDIVNITWETTEAHKNTDPNFTMVSFSGSDDALRLSGLKENAVGKRVMDTLRPVYPGIDEQVQGMKFMDWPKVEFTEASYYFPAPKEVTKWGPLWQAGYQDWLEFAGEHTCFAFMGYMEGALASGFRLARRLAVRDKVLRA